MTDTKIKISPPSELFNPDKSFDPDSIPHTKVSKDTLGLSAVEADEARVSNILHGDYQTQKHMYAQSLESKWGPEKGKIAYKVGSLVGKSLTDKEIEFLDEYHKSKEEIDWKENYFQNNAESYGESTKAFLNRIRRTVEGWDKNQTLFAERYFEQNVPDFLYNQRLNARSEDPDENISWVKWVTQQASDDQLLNLFQWHVHEIQKQQASQETKEVIQDIKNEYKTSVNKGIKAGWLHPDAKAAINEVHNVRVLIGDVFDTIMQERAGYHRRGTKEVVVTQGRKTPYALKGHINLIDNLDDVLKHELNHAVLGLTSETRWLDEALTEHLAQVFDNGEFGIIDPIKRIDMGLGENGIYTPERQLLNVLVNHGSKPINLALFTRNYSLRLSNIDMGKTEMELTDALEEAWGNRYILDGITASVEMLEDKILSEGKLTRLEAQAEALRIVQSDLLQQPEVFHASRQRQTAAA